MAATPPSPQLLPPCVVREGRHAAARLAAARPGRRPEIFPGTAALHQPGLTSAVQGGSDWYLRFHSERAGDRPETLQFLVQARVEENLATTSLTQTVSNPANTSQVQPALHTKAK